MLAYTNLTLKSLSRVVVSYEERAIINLQRYLTFT